MPRRKLTEQEMLEKRADKILSKKKNISDPGAGYYVVRISDEISVSGHWHTLRQKIIEVLQASASLQQA